MASDTATMNFRDEAICPICLELITRPMSIDCGHSFCHVCITRIIESQRQETFHCALCREPFTRNSLRPNRQLENLIESFKEVNKNMCEQHGERLHLFCENDGQLICWCCERSPQHRGHVTALVENACQDYKKKLESTLTKLKQMQDQCNKLKMSMEEQITNWEKTIEKEKQNIHTDFETLYIFLHEEEKSQLSKLEKQKEQALKRLQADRTSLKMQRNRLKNHIVELEKKYQEPECKLLQNVKDILSRSSSVKLELPETFPLDSHIECSVSELYLDVKKMLKSYQVNVTLDPNTAHPDLLVSEDRRCVTGPNSGESLQTERRRHNRLFYSVLGCEGFTSGRHYFEVVVRDKDECSIGVCLESVQRDGDQVQEPLTGFWTIRLLDQPRFVVAMASSQSLLSRMEQLQVLGVFLDYEAGLVSFYNMTTGSHIFTFPKASFPETLRPFFQVCNDTVLCLPLPEN
ncbi:E3 ubiquitin-protein ligase TRIM38-like [Sorex fumeus]|uniref:E3 ubiquitin-protein ligase TRIM38-like n=1 Tax=Sorex fumeus TaxID=62283 RepID=UPI0024AD9F9C|nr:E3 ubiquitin-protein ligase TRIM38-like [Sorex fumeus]